MLKVITAYWCTAQLTLMKINEIYKKIKRLNTDDKGRKEIERFYAAVTCDTFSNGNVSL